MAELIDAAIEHVALVRAEPERVYDALATARGLDGWFTTGAEVDARPGGHIRFRWSDWGAHHYTGEDGGRVLDAERPSRLVFQWNADNRAYATTVAFAFEAVEGGTLVRLRETGYHDTPEGLRAMLGTAAGWGEAITLLKFYVEHGVRY